MKWILFLSLIGLMPLLMSQVSPDLLRSHRWQHRLVLVFHPGAAPDLMDQQEAIPVADPHGWAERDLQLIRLPAGDTDAPALYERFQIESGTFTVLLIGKDGGEKARRVGAILSREDLYALIDTMPMRQAEMRRQSGGGNRP